MARLAAPCLRNLSCVGHVSIVYAARVVVPWVWAASRRGCTGEGRARCEIACVSYRFVPTPAGRRRLVTTSAQRTATLGTAQMARVWIGVLPISYGQQSVHGPAQLDSHDAASGLLARRIRCHSWVLTVSAAGLGWPRWIVGEWSGRDGGVATAGRSCVGEGRRLHRVRA